MGSYIVRIHFTENVRGGLRKFTHELVAEASGPDEAVRLALDYFGQLGRDSWVGWVRTIGTVEVEPLPRGRSHRPELTVVKPSRKPPARIRSSSTGRGGRGVAARESRQDR